MKSMRIFLLLLLSFLGIGSVFASTKYNYHIKSVSKYFKNNVLEIQYNPWVSGGSDGLIIFTKFSNLSKSIKLKLLNWKYILCSMQIHGVYYSNARWLRILPLSSLDKLYLKKLDSNYGNLDIKWGLFTHCVGINNSNIDYNSVFGYVWWNYKQKQLTGGLYMWFKVNLTWLDMSNFVNSVWYVGNTKFVWWIYDTVSWPWFMWWMFKGSQISYSKTVLSYMMWKTSKPLSKVLGLVGDQLTVNGTNYKISTNNTILNILWNLVVKWLVSVSTYKNNVSDNLYNYMNDKKKVYNDLLQRIWGQKNSILIKWNQVNISYLLNRVRRKVSLLCRWNWADSIKYNKLINCIDLSIPWSTINVDLSKLKKWSYIIVRNWNLQINWQVKSDDYYNIFVDGWKLILSNDLQALNNNSFDWEAIILNGSYIINWILEWDGPWGSFNHQLIIKWHLASLNTLGTPMESRISLVKNITSDQNLWANNINLNDIFTWSLWINWIWVDNRKPYTKYPNQALVIQAYNYKSLFMK